MTASSTSSTASPAGIVIEDADAALHIERDGVNVRATIIPEEDGAPAPYVVMTRAEARKFARDLLAMTR